MPGADNWREDRDAPHLADMPIIYIVREPDMGGEAVDGWLATSAIRERVRIVSLDEHKDVSGLYLADPEHFHERWETALTAAVPWAARAAADAAVRRSEAAAGCRELMYLPRILDAFADALRRSGVVGERAAAMLLYLIITSRLLARPA